MGAVGAAGALENELVSGLVNEIGVSLIVTDAVAASLAGAIGAIAGVAATAGAAEPGA